MVFNSQPGPDSRNGLAAERRLALPPSIAPEPRTQTHNWRATATTPSDLITGQPASIPFQPQAGTAARIARPQLALRELVLSPLRASSCDRALSQSSSGVHVALPPAGTATHVSVPASVSSDIWKTETAKDLPSNRFLRQSEEMRSKHELSTDGARTALAKTKLMAAVSTFPTGLISALRGDEPKVVADDPPIKDVPASLPLPRSGMAARPIVALPEGLVVWGGVFNSYVRRIVCSPRLLESVRDVHALRLAPAKKVQDDTKISGALLCSTTETLPISDSGGDSPAGKGEVNGKARIEYADPRRA